MSNNYGPGVSDTNNNQDTSFDVIVFQKGRPPLDREWNQVQDISNEERRRLTRATTHSGFINGAFSVVTENWNEDGFYVSNTSNQFEIRSSSSNHILGSAVNGHILKINGSIVNDPTNPSPENSVATIKLNDPPSSGSRDDLVFLEI